MGNWHHNDDMIGIGVKSAVKRGLISAEEKMEILKRLSHLACDIAKHLSLVSDIKNGVNSLKIKAAAVKARHITAAAFVWDMCNFCS